MTCNAGCWRRRLGFEESEAIFEYLRNEGFIDAKGKVQDTLRQALKEGMLVLPEPYAARLPEVREVLRKVAGRLDIKNANDRIVVRTRQAMLHSAEFQALWDRIKHRTSYRVHFDNEQLIADCAKAIANGPPITKARVTIRKTDLAIGQPPNPFLYALGSECRHLGLARCLEHETDCRFR